MSNSTVVPPHPAVKVQTLQDNLQHHLDTLIAANQTLTGISVYTIAPSLNLDWGIVAGVTQRGGDIPIDIKHPLRIASITKSFVAAAILRLYEQGRINLEAGIDQYLPKSCTHILKTGGYNPNQLTSRQLLTHTSGLLDFFYTEGFAALQPDLISGRDKQLYTLEDQLKMAMTSEVDKPSEQYNYSDTNYILLGAILEQLTQTDMGSATRELIGYDALGLADTWWEVLEKPPSNTLPPLHQYLGEYDYRNNTPPFDLYGGGGMISTPRDVARFFYHLFHGRVFKRDSTLKLMLDTLETNYPEIENPDLRTTPGVYGLGIARINLAGCATYCHSGWWGINGCYVPALNLAIGVAVTQQHFKQLVWDLPEMIIKEIKEVAGEQ